MQNLISKQVNKQNLTFIIANYEKKPRFTDIPVKYFIFVTIFINTDFYFSVINCISEYKLQKLFEIILDDTSD